MTDRQQHGRWKLAFYEEPSGSFEQQHVTYGDFLSVVVRQESVKPDVDRDRLETMSTKYDPDDRDLALWGARKCALDFAITGHSHGLDLKGDHSATLPDTDNWPFARILKNVMGGIWVHQPASPSAETQVQSGSTSTQIKVTTGHGALWEPGCGIGVPTSAVPNGIECAEVLSVSGDDVNLKQALKGTPVEGEAVRGAVTFFLVDYNGYLSLQAVVEGDGTTDAKNLRGLLGGFSLEKELGGLLVFSFSFMGTAYTLLGANGNISAPGSSYFQPVVALPSALTFPTVGSTARVELCQAESVWTPAIGFELNPCGDADNKYDGHWRVSPEDGVISGSILTPRDEDAGVTTAQDYFYSAWENSTEHAVFEQLGNQPGDAGGAILLAARQVQTGAPDPEPYGPGQRGQRVPWWGRPFQSGTDAKSKSALAIHVF